MPPDSIEFDEAINALSATRRAKATSPRILWDRARSLTANGQYRGKACSWKYWVGSDKRDPHRRHYLFARYSARESIAIAVYTDREIRANVLLGVPTTRPSYDEYPGFEQAINALSEKDKAIARETQWTPVIHGYKQVAGQHYGRPVYWARWHGTKKGTTNANRTYTRPVWLFARYSADNKNKVISLITLNGRSAGKLSQRDY